jgi:hypothetical protein
MWLTYSKYSIRSTALLFKTVYEYSIVSLLFLLICKNKMNNRFNMKTQSLKGMNVFFSSNGEPEKITFDFNNLGNDYKEMVLDFLEDLYDHKIISERQNDDVLSEEDANRLIHS